MRATRRAAIAASGAALMGLVGCTEGEPDASSTPAPDADPAVTEAPPDPDLVALERAATLTAALLAETREVAPRLDPGGRLEALHRAHLAALARAAGPHATPVPVPRNRPALRSRTRLRRAELGAQRELAQLARHAQDGALARLFASMSAAIAAHLAVPDEAVS